MSAPPDPRPPRATASRMLLVARGFPPYADPTSYRWLRFVRALVRHGWQVDVLTVRAEPLAEQYDERLTAQIPAEVGVHRVYPGFYQKRVVRARREKIQTQRAGSGGTAGAARRPRELPLRGVLRRMDEALERFKIPDPSFEWIPWGIRRGVALHRACPYDLLVSSAAPFSSHVVAHAIARKSHLRWVADFSDPYLLDPFVQRSAWRRALDGRMEGSWMATLDGIIVPVQEMADLYRAHYPGLQGERIHLVPYGYADELYATVAPRVLPGFSIVHTGVFYPGMRDPTPFLQAVARVRDVPLRVVHAGGLTDAFRRLIEDLGIASRFDDRGFLSKAEVASLQLGGSCLLLIGNKGGVQLPGKLLDYFGARRPILALPNDAHDIAANLVAATGSGEVVENEPGAIASAIRRLHGWWSEGTLDRRFNLGAGGEFAWARQEEKLVEALARHV